ncbi:MAG TPA: hypothetical protein VIR82_04280, partial [Bradyrhizobium sp.]
LLKQLHGVDEGLGDARKQWDAGETPGESQLQRRGFRGRSVLHDVSYAPVGLLLAATSALIWPARCPGFIDAMMRETWNAAQSSSSRANGILA